MEHKRFILWKKVLAMFMIITILFSYMPVNAVYGYVEEINAIVSENDEDKVDEFIEVEEVLASVTEEDNQEENTTNVPNEDNTNGDIKQDDSEQSKIENTAKEPETNITENQTTTNVIENNVVVETEKEENTVEENTVNTNTVENNIANNVENNIENNISNTTTDNLVSEDKNEETNLITLDGICVWKDNNNAYNTRPEKIALNLLKNNEVVISKEITLDEFGNWKYVFENLEKYDENNVEIKYTISVEKIENYETIIDENNNVVSVLNGKTELTGIKNWKDNNNAYNTRPEKIVLNLLKNDEILSSKEFAPDKLGNWNYIFNDLEKYDENGTEIKYTVTENEIPGYENKIDENGILISVLKESVKFTGNISWEDNDNENNTRPTSVNVNIYKENEDLPIETIIVSQSENWAFEFSSLEKYDENGIKINYTITQTEIEEYETTVNSIEENNVNIVNKQLEMIKFELTWQELLEYGPYMAMLVKYAEENNETVSAEEMYIYEQYKELIYGRGAELAATALMLGTDGFTEEELAIYNAYQEIILNGGELYPIKTLDIEANGDYKSREVLSVRRSGDGFTLRYLQYDGDVIRNSIKYVASSDGAAPKKGDPAAYCMNYERDYAEDAKYITDAWKQMMEQKKYKEYEPFFSKLYSELSYVVSIGCKEYGKHSQSGYSTKDFIKNYTGYSSNDAKWEEDYYATQTVIYIILNDYITNFNDILKDMNITVTDENVKNQIYDKLKEMYSGHPFDSKLKINSDDTNSSYNGAHQKAVLDAVKKMYNAALEQRKVINKTDSDGYDSSITITPEKQNLKYENGNWIATISVNTTGTKVGSISFSGPSGMKTSYNKTTKTYTITIPAENIKDVNKVQISAQATFKANKTVTYICSDSDNQNIAFYQSDSADNISKSTVATLQKTETVTISGNKTWVDNGNEYKTRPNSITINLLADGVFVASKTVTASDGWSWKFTGHAKYNSSNKEIKYTITENAVTGYSSKINGNNVVNSLKGTTKVEGTKTWIDNNNEYQTRPDSIKINLFKNGNIEKIITVKPDATGNWSYKFEGLTKYDENGKLYEYTITEDSVVGYETNYSGNNIINKLVGKTEISGIKTWKDNDNAYITRPESITVNLLKNGKVEETKIVKPDVTGNWIYEFKDLAKYDENGKLYEYEIVEEDIDNYKTEYDGNNIINTLTGKTEISGIKTWKDNNNAYITRPESITVNLFRNEETEPLQTLIVEPDLLGNWTYKFKDLEKYDNEGKLYTYSITEEKVNKYETTIETVAETEINITNKLTDETEVKGNKSWVDNNNAYGTRPKSINLILLANGEKVAEKEVTADEDGNWNFAFTNLFKYDDDGVKIKYTIEENDVLGYITNIENVSETETNIINKLTGETEIAGAKLWKDNNNAYATRPESIIVNLLANGEKISEKEISSDENGNWNFAFTNLLKYDENGVKIKYTIEENAVLGYITDIENIDENKTNLINTLVGKIEVNGLKIWEDYNNAYATRPDCIVVNLLANGEKVAEKTVSEDAEGKWKFVFEDLEEYDKNGVKIEYAIAENPVLGYSTTIVGTNIINRVNEKQQATETLDLTPTTGKKNWLKHFIITAITSLFGMIFAKKRKLLGEGK